MGGKLASPLVGVAGWLARLSANQLASLPAGWLSCWPVRRLDGWPVGWPVGWFGWLDLGPVGWSLGWLADRPADLADHVGWPRL